MDKAKSGFKAIEGVQVMPLDILAEKQDVKKPGLYRQEDNDAVLVNIVASAFDGILTIPAEKILSTDEVSRLEEMREKEKNIVFVITDKKDVKADGRGNHKEVYR